MYIVRSLLAALLLLAASPGLAQTREDEPPGPLDELGESLRQQLESLLDELTPEVEELLDELRKLDRYEAPEILPNGDIIIRRKPDPEPDQDEDEAPDDTLNL
ncbi:MAG: hypothetical protein AAGE18_08760 [Pseudomonadota bacterium]